MDVECLHSDILLTLPSDPIAQTYLLDTTNPRWSTNNAGFLHLNGHMYVPEADDLQLHVLWFKHDHLLSGHFGQNRTLELIGCEYTWPEI